MPSRTAKPATLGLFWFGVQVVWGALLGVSLQSRISEFAAGNAVAAYGPIAAAGAAVAAVTQIVVGVISDRRRVRGSRRLEFYLAGVAVACPALLWLYLAPSLGQLTAALIFVQIGMNIAIGPYQAVIPDFVPEAQLGNASSWMAGLQSAGNACGAIVAALIANSAIVAAAIIAALLATCAATASHVRSLALLNARLEPVRISRAFVDLFISRALVFLGFYTLLGYLFFYVRGSLGSGDTKMLTGLVILAVTASGTIGALAAAHPADRYDRRVVAASGGAGFVVALGALLLAHSLAAIVGSALAAGVAWGVFLSGDWALGCQLLPRFALATAMGIWNLALLLPQILAPLIATAVLAWMHDLQSPQAARIAFVIAAIEVLCGIAWIWRLPASLSSVEKAPSGNTP
ncbi:MAG TPA: MFS transporter [Candidatus Baltobacteraceae bacterium]|nr:MFS transporter [Candidatus Baltobacteraceae bacterium]